MEQQECFTMESSLSDRDEVSSEEDVDPTSSSDKVHRSCEDVSYASSSDVTYTSSSDVTYASASNVIYTSSSDVSERLNRMYKKLESLTHHIDQDIELLEKANQIFANRSDQPATMDTKRQKQMTWGEILSANRGTHHGVYKPQCRTVKIRSSSKELQPRVSAGCFPSCCCCDQNNLTTYQESYGGRYPSLPNCTAQRKVTDLNTQDMCRYRYVGEQPNRKELRSSSRQSVSKQKKPKVIRSSKGSPRASHKEPTGGVDKRINSKKKEKMPPETQQRVSTSSNSPKVSSPISEPEQELTEYQDPRVPMKRYPSEFSGTKGSGSPDENRNDFRNTRQVGTETEEERFSATSVLSNVEKSTQVYSRPIYLGAGSPRRSQEQSTLSNCEVRITCPRNIDEDQFYRRRSSSEEFVNLYDGLRVDMRERQSQLSEEISSDTEEPIRILPRETEEYSSGSPSPQGISRQSIDSENYRSSDYPEEEDFREVSPKRNSLRNSYLPRVSSQSFKGDPRPLNQENDGSLRLSISEEDDIESRSGSLNSNQINRQNLNWRRSPCCQKCAQRKMTLMEKRTRKVTFQDEMERCVAEELAKMERRKVQELEQMKLDELEQSQKEEQRRSLIDWSTNGNTPRSSSSGEHTCIEDSSDDWESYISCEDTLSPIIEEMPMPNICPCMYEQYRELEALCLNMAPFPR